MCTVGKIFVEIVGKLLEISFSQYMVCDQRRDGGDIQHTEGDSSGGGGGGGGGEISTPPPLPPPPPQKKKKKSFFYKINYTKIISQVAPLLGNPDLPVRRSQRRLLGPFTVMILKKSISFQSYIFTAYQVKDGKELMEKSWQDLCWYSIY